MITTELKKRIIEAVQVSRGQYTSDIKHAKVLGINEAQYSRVFKKGELDKVISPAHWVSIARICNVKLDNSEPWVTVNTETFSYITTQLTISQERSVSGMFCDLAGIGKSYTAKIYCKTNKHAIYIDCSLNKTKQKLVRKIAREFGINHTGRLSDVFEDLIFYIRTLQNPLIILDEAGDLSADAFLELKALWNATEYICGWYMMGADGLKVKFNRQKDLKKVGYAEIFDRYGSSFKRISPEGKEALKAFKLQQIALISKANKSNITALQMYAKTNGSLRKLKIQIEKQRLLNA